MSSTIKIYESQSVIFTDTTSGGLPPYDRNWSFNGGDIASATGATAIVRYDSPGQYTATLTVTDSNNVTKSFISSRGIDVLSAFVTSSFTVAPNPLLMSQTAQFSNNSTGVPEAPSSYQWIIGGSNYSTATNPTLKYDDWQLVPGANIAAPPGSTVLVSTRLDATSSFTTGTSSSNLTITKTGLSERTLINRSGEANPYSQEGIISSTGKPAGSLGYPNNSFIFEIDFSSSTGPQVINGFHSTQESARITLTGLSGDPLFVTSGVSKIEGYIIVENDLYTTGDNQIVNGRYISPNLPSGPPKKLFFADAGNPGNITDLVSNGNFTLALIESIMNNVYPQLNSTQSDYWSPVFPETTISPGINPVVYSPIYFFNLGYPGIEYEVYIDVLIGVNQITISCPFNANSGNGNEPNGNEEYYVMQDVSGNDGVVTQLNNAISASSIPGGTGDIEFSAVQSYNIRGESSAYYGLKMEVKNENIIQIRISDNSASLNSSLGISLAPFTYLHTGIPGVISCSGMPPVLNLLVEKYLDYGKNIVYGNTIF